MQLSLTWAGVLASSDRSLLAEIGKEFGLSRDEMMLVFRGPQAAENALAGQKFGFSELEAAMTNALPSRLGDRAPSAAASLLRMYTDPVAMKVIPEMVELLRELQAARVPVGCLSNGPKGVLASSWRPLLGDALPETVHLSGETGIGKPEAAAFEAIAGALGFSVAECLFIDDTQHHVDGARAAGMRAVQYEGVAEVIRAELRTVRAHRVVPRR